MANIDFNVHVADDSAQSSSVLKERERFNHSKSLFFFNSFCLYLSRITRVVLGWETLAVSYMIGGYSLGKLFLKYNLYYNFLFLGFLEILRRNCKKELTLKVVSRICFLVFFLAEGFNYMTLKPFLASKLYFKDLCENKTLVFFNLLILSNISKNSFMVITFIVFGKLLDGLVTQLSSMYETLQKKNSYILKGELESARSVMDNGSKLVLYFFFFLFQPFGLYNFFYHVYKNQILTITYLNLIFLLRFGIGFTCWILTQYLYKMRSRYNLKIINYSKGTYFKDLCLTFTTFFKGVLASVTGLLRVVTLRGRPLKYGDRARILFLLYLVLSYIHVFYCTILGTIESTLAIRAFSVSRSTVSNQVLRKIKTSIGLNLVALVDGYLVSLIYMTITRKDKSGTTLTLFNTFLSFVCPLGCLLAHFFYRHDLLPFTTVLFIYELLNLNYRLSYNKNTLKSPLANSTKEGVLWIEILLDLLADLLMVYWIDRNIAVSTLNLLGLGGLSLWLTLMVVFVYVGRSYLKTEKSEVQPLIDFENLDLVY